jgi:hypothetical protein
MLVLDHGRASPRSNRPDRQERRALRHGATALQNRAGNRLGWASVIAFAEDARAELMRLRAEDPLTVQGEARLGTYTAKSGELRPSLEVTVAHVLALRQPAKLKQPARAPAFGDLVPFRGEKGTWLMPNAFDTGSSGAKRKQSS